MNTKLTPLAGLTPIDTHPVLGAVLSKPTPIKTPTRFDEPATFKAADISPFQEVKINTENAAQYGQPVSGNRAAELSLRPILAAHELSLGPLHAEALRLLCKHQEEPTSYTFARLLESVNLIGLKIGGTVHF